MMFKFGALVLLLFLENTVAEQRLPTLPTVNLASALEHIPHLRRGLLRAYRSPVRGQPLGSFSRSLQSTEATCAWDAEREECSLSISSMKYLLEKSKTEFATMLVEGFTCVEKMNKTDCNKERSCLWVEELDECDYVDMRRSHEESPCAKAAPLFFDYYEASVGCGKQSSRRRCERNRQCAWSSVTGRCDADSNFILFNIKSFSDKYAQVAESVRATLETQYASLQSVEDFSWQSILDYKPNTTECPFESESLICDFVTTLMSGILGPAFYCSGKYKSVEIECREDSLCMWNETSEECRSDESRAMSAARLASSRVLTDSLPDGIDKAVLENFFTCDNTIDERSCQDTCVWNPARDDCDISTQHQAALLTELAENSTDALCTYLDVDGSSDCYTQFTQRKCHKREFCRWNAKEECLPKEESHFSAAGEGDWRLKRRYKRFKKRCSTHTTEKACVV